MRGDSAMHRIGILSDTHGLVRPETSAALEGVERILHAGDVGGARVIEELEAIAPVTAVRGNVDVEPWAGRLPETAIVEVGGLSILVVHDLARLELDPGSAGLAAVVHGHSHRPSVERRGGVLFVNPGSAGPYRLGLPVTVAWLEVAAGAVRAEVVTVED